MKYTFINPTTNQEQTVNIDDAWIKKQVQLLGITKREAIDMYLSDEGYIEDETVATLTQKAKENKCGASGYSTKPRKKPQRKPDETKRELIDLLYTTLGNAELELDCGPLENVEVTNIERHITFENKGDVYEITLSKKRKPKI